MKRYQFNKDYVAAILMVSFGLCFSVLIVRSYSACLEQLFSWCFVLLNADSQCKNEFTKST